MAEGILQGIRVIEWGRLVSGPWTARLLGDLGADVIKVEPPMAGDEARRVGPFPQDLPHLETSGLHLYLNCNKRGITLDLSKATGRQIFERLVQGADILVENHRPSEVEALGLTYESLRALNPNLVMVSISPFGQTGPFRDYAGSELVIFSTGGLSYETAMFTITDPEKEQPLKGPGYQGYFVTGWLAASSALIGLFHREVAGVGQLIDISEQEAVASMLRPNVTRYSYVGEVTKRQTSALTAFFRYKPCKDGFFQGIGVGQNERAWQQLSALMGSPEWTTWEIFATQESRIEHREEADALIIEWMMNYTKAELFEMTQKLGMGAFPFNTVADLYTSEQLLFRGFFKEVEHPIAGAYPYAGPAYLFSAQQPRIHRPAPLLGEHNEEVYCGELGYSREELAQLRYGGVI